MDRAGRKGEEPDQAALPAREILQCRRQQDARDAAAPVIGMNRDRPQHAETAPTAGEGEPDHRAAGFGDDAAIGISMHAPDEEPGIAAELHRVGQLEPGAEGQAKQMIGGGEIALAHRAQGDGGVSWTHSTAIAIGLEYGPASFDYALCAPLRMRTFLCATKGSPSS